MYTVCLVAFFLRADLCSRSWSSFCTAAAARSATRSSKPELTAPPQVSKRRPRTPQRMSYAIVTGPARVVFRRAAIAQQHGVFTNLYSNDPRDIGPPSGSSDTRPTTGARSPRTITHPFADARRCFAPEAVRVAYGQQRPAASGARPRTSRRTQHSRPACTARTSLTGAFHVHHGLQQWLQFRLARAAFKRQAIPIQRQAPCAPSGSRP